MRISTASFAAALLALLTLLTTTVAHADEPPPYGPPTRAPSIEDVRVHVTPAPGVKGRADLFALGRDEEYGWICTVPCNTVLPAHTPIAVRLEKSDDAAQATISPRLGRDVDVTVSKPRKTATIVGWSLLGAGLATITASAVTIAAFSSMEKEGAYFSGTAFGLLIGVPIGVVGLVLSGVGGGVLATASDAPSVKVTSSGVDGAPR